MSTSGTHERGVQIPKEQVGLGPGPGPMKTMEAPVSLGPGARLGAGWDRGSGPCITEGRTVLGLPDARAPTSTLTCSVVYSSPPGGHLSTAVEAYGSEDPRRLPPALSPSECLCGEYSGGFGWGCQRAGRWALPFTPASPACPVLPLPPQEKPGAHSAYLEGCPVARVLGYVRAGSGGHRAVIPQIFCCCPGSHSMLIIPRAFTKFLPKLF